MVREVISQSAIYSSDRSRINDSHRRGIVAFVYDHEHVHIFSRLSYRHTGYNLSHPPKLSCESARGRDMCIQYNLAFNVDLRLSNKLTRLTFMLIFLELVRLLLPVTTVHDRWLDSPQIHPFSYCLSFNGYLTSVSTRYTSSCYTMFFTVIIMPSSLPPHEVVAFLALL